MKERAGAVEPGLYAAVPGVADDGMADGGEVDADLVCASGLELASQQGDGNGFAVTVFDAVAGPGGAACGSDGHLRGFAS